MKNRLYRDERRKVIGGVCAGLADYFNVDVSLVRVVFVLALILKGGGGLFYIILWAVIPQRPFVAPAGGFAMPPPDPQPFVPVKKSVSTGSIIGGLILIMLGGYLLLNQYDIIPDLDFDKFWPIVLIVIGLVLMFGFWQRKPVEPEPASWDKKDNLNDTSSTTDHSQNI